MTSNCGKSLAFSLLLCWIGIPQGLADVVVPISISQQFSVSGNVTACDFGCYLGYGIQDAGNSFSFANTNTQLPPKGFPRTEALATRFKSRFTSEPRRFTPRPAIRSTCPPPTSTWICLCATISRETLP
jgi:hypothetical protein